MPSHSPDIRKALLGEPGDSKHERNSKRTLGEGPKEIEESSFEEDQTQLGDRADVNDLGASPK